MVEEDSPSDSEPAGSDPGPVAGNDGLEFVTFGAPLDGGYEPPDWG